MKRYESSADVALRLHGTIAKYKDEWYYCFIEEGSTRLFLYDNPSGTKKAIVDANDENLVLTSPTLGYIEYEGLAYFVQRTPVRRQKQQIAAENLWAFNSYKQKQEIVSSSLFGCKNIISMLKKDYADSFETAVQRVSAKTFIGLPISQNMAVHRTVYNPTKIYLSYKTILLGRINEENRLVLEKAEMNNTLLSMLISEKGIQLA